MTQAQQRRTAVVTGSARRVGRAIAVALVEDGWDVLVHARDAARAREACGEIGAAGWAGADLAEVDAATTITAAARETFGPDIGLDLLVNSAASFERVEPWESADAAGWKRAMAVNARAPYLLTGALLPMLRIARGLVVNVSDHAGHEHWPTYPIHSAAKAALNSLTLSGATALAADGVRMCAVSPGTILAPDEWDDARIEREHEARGVGTPADLVRVILELAGDASRTGELIVL